MALHTSFTETDLAGDVQALVKQLGRDRVLVGIPDEGGTRRGKALDRAANMAEEAVANGTPTTKAVKLAKAAAKDSNLSNAQLLYIFTNGSPRNNQPARVVIEAAIMQPQTRDRINRELVKAGRAELDGDHAKALEHFQRAGTIAENASKRWFTDPANGWAPNAPSTIARKLGKLSTKKKAAALATIATQGNTDGVVTPGIDTGQMRRAITHVVVDN